MKTLEKSLSLFDSTCIIVGIIIGVFLSWLAPRGIVAADLSGDMLADLAVSEHDGRRVAVFTNLGGATFGAASFVSGSRKVTLALISGFRSLSLSRIVTLTITVALVRSAVGITWRSTAL